MEKEKTEREKLFDEIIKLMKRRNEYFEWLRKNIDSPNWDEVKENWNELNIRINDLREQRDHIVLNNL